MAREAYRSLYGDLTKLKDPSLLDGPAAGAATDDALFQLLLAVSEAIDGYCNRHFYPVLETRLFDGTGDRVLLLPDLVSVSALHEDADGDGTHDSGWAADDYQLLPLNAAPEQHWGGPHTALRVRLPDSARRLAPGPARYRIDGVWGYRRLVEQSGSALDGVVSDLAGAVTVDDGAHFAVGQTIVVEGEQMLVTAIAGDVLSVRRALNGTAAAAHPGGAAVGILRWPAPVERAALMNTARIWTRAPAFEPFYVDADLDTDVRALLDPYRRPAA